MIKAVEWYVVLRCMYVVLLNLLDYVHKDNIFSVRYLPYVCTIDSYHSSRR